MTWREEAPCWPTNWPRIERLIDDTISSFWWIPATPDAGWKLLRKGEQICEDYCDFHSECDEYVKADKVGVWAGQVRGMVRPENRRGTK